jgi:MoaA/NifB/PqqE/SkfB family radical SAM enzyme
MRMLKFWRRTLRNLVFRKRPYFAHLAITHRCNLRCRFCHIPEWNVAEQDTAGFRRIIDRLDALGVAILSISGGGEPLLRKDCIDIINYAANRGLYTKINSNGTMPLARYEELLRSQIKEIGISLDGVAGNDLPYSHTGPKILETVGFLDRHLPQGKHLTLTITVTPHNAGQIEEMIAHCTRQFTRTRLWLNPVVVGEGRLRVWDAAKVNPEFLYRVDSPTLLTPRFYKDACMEYYRSAIYNWQCMAGELFFDVKPNGEFWTCQDHAAPTPLNILDDDFEEKYRQADFSHRRQCSGCTYSCYYMTQKAFEPRHWPEMAGVYWWRQTTQPGEVFRAIERRRPLEAFLRFCWSRAVDSAPWGGWPAPAAGPPAAGAPAVQAGDALASD